MSTTTASPSSPPMLLRTPLFDLHRKLGGKMVDFAGWEMPLHFGSILAEHHQVRKSAGFFDVSHMGRLRFSGKDAARFLDHLCTRRIDDMTAGQARYSLVCNEQGGCHDDVLVYRLDESEFVMVCNASNRAKIVAHINVVKAAGGFVFKFEDQTTTTAMIALQGPAVIPNLARVSSEVESLKRYRFVVKNVMGFEIMISRTGYTGEDGVEVILPASFAPTALEMLIADVPSVSDPNAPIKPAGLGARDSLRLEASMALYGHEITEEIDPLSAGLDFAVSLGKPAAFIGQKAMEQVKAQGSKRRLVGLKLEGRRAARQGMAVLTAPHVTPGQIGLVTSGCLSPTLGYSIAMAMVDVAHAPIGTTVQVDLAGAMTPAAIVPMPFYKAGK